MPFVNKGFHGRPRQPGTGLVPPGQYVVDDFPVLTAGRTPKLSLDLWDFTITDESGARLARWTWDELRANVLEATSLHFEDGPVHPRLVQLHYVKDELIPVEAA